MNIKKGFGCFAAAAMALASFAATFKDSYIWIDKNPAPTKVGDDVVLTVHYHLEPTDTWGSKPTKLSVTPLGPWIDNPDGVINKSRHHVSYGGQMFTKE